MVIVYEPHTNLDVALFAPNGIAVFIKERSWFIPIYTHRNCVLIKRFNDGFINAKMVIAWICMDSIDRNVLFCCNHC